MNVELIGNTPQSSIFIKIRTTVFRFIIEYKKFK
jgi:hypothetical protein